MRGSRAAGWLIGGGVLWWVYTVAHYVHGAFLYRGYGDFFLLMKAVREWLVTGQFTAEYVYLYPPVFYLLNAPLARLGDAAAVQVMLGLNQVLLVVMCWLLVQVMEPRPDRRLWWWALLPLALNFRPLLLTLSMAKIELLQIDLVLGACWAVRRGRPGVTGTLVALAGMIKPLPLLLVLYFVWKRDWRVVRAWVVAVATLLVVSGIVMGFPAVWTHFSNLVAPRGVNAIYWFEDQSLMGVAVRLLHPPVAEQYHVPAEQVGPLSLALGWTLRALTLVWLGALTRPRSAAGRDRLMGEWAIILAGMLLLSPFTRDYYAVFLLPGYLWLAQCLWSCRGRVGWWRAATLGAASYLLVGQGFPLGLLTRLPPLWPGLDNFHLYLHYGIPTLGTLLAVAAWAQALRVSESPEEGAGWDASGAVAVTQA